MKKNATALTLAAARAVALLLGAITTAAALFVAGCGKSETDVSAAAGSSSPASGIPTSTYILPAPKPDGKTSVERALSTRRTQRQFQTKALTREQLSQLLWSAYGITAPPRFRTAPSAGGTYPLEIYVAVGTVKGIEPGLYKYSPREHKITRTINTDIRTDLTQAALDQKMINAAPVTLIFTAVFDRTTARYGERGVRYVWMEAGHSAQNVYLQATALHLGTCAIGAFEDKKLAALLQLPPKEAPLYLMPVGFVD